MSDDHKYKIGQTINFRSAARGPSAPNGQYRVVGYRPPDSNGEPSYRIKSELERHDRIARESELQWIS
jgi:hypothetical protein